MQTNNKIKDTIGKREVTNLSKKISSKLLGLKTISEVKSLIEDLVPDVQELMGEKYENDLDDEFVVDFIIPRNYVGKHTKSEFTEAEEDCMRFISFGSVNFSVYKKRDCFEVYANAWFEYETEWGEISGKDLPIKYELVSIPLDFRNDEIEKIKTDIRLLSSGTISKLISDENVGSASSLYLLIDEVQKRLYNSTLKYIESTNDIPKNWINAWNIFKRENSIKEIAYELGIDKSKVEPNYEIYIDCENKIKSIQEELKDILNNDVDFSILQKEYLRKLSYVYALKVLMKHCSNNKEEYIKKILKETIPQILEDKYDEEFYKKHAKDGFDVLMKM